MRVWQCSDGPYSPHIPFTHKERNEACTRVVIYWVGPISDNNWVDRLHVSLFYQIVAACLLGGSFQHVCRWFWWPDNCGLRGMMCTQKRSNNNASEGENFTTIIKQWTIFDWTTQTGECCRLVNNILHITFFAENWIWFRFCWKSNSWYRQRLRWVSTYK